MSVIKTICIELEWVIVYNIVHKTPVNYNQNNKFLHSYSIMYSAMLLFELVSRL